MQSCFKVRRKNMFLSSYCIFNLSALTYQVKVLLARIFFLTHILTHIPNPPIHTPKHTLNMSRITKYITNFIFDDQQI